MGLKTKRIGMFSGLLVLMFILVASASAQPSIPTPPLPPIFIDLNITPSEIEPGNEVTISFTITNIDNQTFTYTVIMQVGELNFPIDVELEAYESKTVSRSITQYIPGEYNVTIDSLEGSFTVKHPEITPPPLPPIISNLIITPDELELGDEVTINFDIENYGSQSQTYGVAIHIENVNDPPPTWPPYDITMKTWVDLGAYEFKTVFFTITMNDVGDFNVTVAGMTASFMVIPPDPWPVIDDVDPVIIVVDPLEELNLRIDSLTEELRILQTVYDDLQDADAHIISDQIHEYEQIVELEQALETYSNEVSDQIENLENKISRLQNYILYACIATAIISVLGAFLLIKRMN